MHLSDWDWSWTWNEHRRMAEQIAREAAIRRELGLPICPELSGAWAAMARIMGRSRHGVWQWLCGVLRRHPATAGQTQGLPGQSLPPEALPGHPTLEGLALRQDREGRRLVLVKVLMELQDEVAAAMPAPVPEYTDGAGTMLWVLADVTVVFVIRKMSA